MAGARPRSHRRGALRRPGQRAGKVPVRVLHGQEVDHVQLRDGFGRHLAEIAEEPELDVRRRAPALWASR